MGKTLKLTALSKDVQLMRTLEIMVVPSFGALSWPLKERQSLEYCGSSDGQQCNDEVVCHTAQGKPRRREREEMTAKTWKLDQHLTNGKLKKKKEELLRLSLSPE